MSNLVQYIKSDPSIKRFVHWLLIPKNQARPRTWVKWFVNPFFHHKGKNSSIRRRSRIDVLPFNQFVLGHDSTIEDFCTINNGVGDVFIGNHTRIGIGSVLIGPVTVGNEVRLAQNVVMSGLNHVYEDVTKPISRQPVTVNPVIIDDETWLGANVFVAAGVKIGKHCVVAGGSVVTKNVPDYCVVVGNPAKIIKKYNKQTMLWEKVSSE